MRKLVKLSALALTLAVIGCNSSNGDSKVYKDLEISDTNAGNYTLNSVYDNDNGLVVKGILSDGTKENISKDNYTYTVLNPDNEMVDTSKKFTETGKYTLLVTHKKLSKNYFFNVNTTVVKTLVDIDFTLTNSSFKTSDVLENKISSIFSAKLVYNISSYNVDNISYSQLSANNLSLELYNPSGTKVSVSNKFSTAGNWSLKLKSTENTSITKTKTITVADETIKVTGITLSPTSVNVEEGSTATINATVTPTNATNKNLTWTSNNTSICTVSNGVVTGKSAGTTTIKVTAQDGSGVSATSSVTVKSKVEPTQSEYHLVTNVSEIASGDTIIIVSKDKEKVAGSYNSSSSTKYLEGTTLVFGEDDTTITSVSSTTSEFVLGKSSSYWTLTNASTNKKLGATAAKKLSYDATTSTWSIAISSGDATISSSNSSYGRIVYNCGNGSPRFSNYTSDLSDTMLLPQIYKKGSSEPIYPTAISLSETTTTIGQGQSKQLNVTYSPTGVNKGKGVTWTSDNESIATVSNGLVNVKSTATIGSIVTITATSTYDTSLVASCAVTVSEVQQDKWTILMYMCGSNLESETDKGESGCATLDIEEVLSVSGQPDDVNIIIETGGSNVDNDYFSTSKLNRFEVRNQKATKVATKSIANMGNSSTLKDFITWGIETYPAEKIGLILWNHGGATTGVCFDELYDDDGLTNSEIKSAISSSFGTLGRTDKLEFIGYDACLMSIIDFADFNSAYFNYMCASEESEAGEGWAYNTWIDNLYNGDSTLDILKANCDGFVDSQGGKSKTGVDNQQCLSVLDLAYMPTFKTEFESFASTLYSKISSKVSSFATFMKGNVKYFGDSLYESWSDLIYYESYESITQAKQYGCYQTTTSGYTVYVAPGYSYFATFDVLDFLNKVTTQYSIDVTNVKTALNNVIKYSVAQKGAGNAYGLAAFFPVFSDFSFYTEYDFYVSSQTNFTNWLKIVNLLLNS